MIEEPIGKDLLTFFTLFDSVLVAQLAQEGLKHTAKHELLELQIFALSET